MRVVPWTEKNLMAHEDTFEALTAKAVQATMKRLRTELLSSHRPLTAAADLPAPPPQTAPPVSFTAVENAVMATWTAAVDSELFPFLTSTFTQSAERVVQGVQAVVGKTVEPLTNAFATEYLQYAHNRMVGIGQQLWEVLRAEMVEGFQAGEGIKEIAARLSHVGGLATPRALTTARTEVIGAANGGSYAQMLAAGFDDTEVTKVWLATEDTRTRISHRHADNQGVELTGEFTLDIYKGDVKTGTEGLEYPGDPTGTPGNVINCRCSLAFDFTEDQENENEPMTAASYFNEKLHPRDEHGKFTKKGDAGKLFKALDTAEKLKAIASVTQKDWDKLSDDEKSQIAGDVADLPDSSSKSLLTKKLKTLGGAPAPTAGWKTGDPVPGKDASSLAKAQYLINEKLGEMSAMQVASLAKVLKQSDWDGLSEKEQTFLSYKISGLSHPEAKFQADKALADLKAGEGPGALNVKQAVEKAVKEAAPAGTARPQGGKDTKTGKELAPGKPVKLRVQLLYNTSFEDGAVMAVRKDSDERIVWQNGKILRQKKGPDGKFHTTETKTRGDAYKAWKDEDGWTVPETAPAAAAAPAAPTAGAVGKPTTIKVQLVYQTPFNDGDTVAVNPTTGQKITWDAGKKRMVVHEADGSTKEYTRGALYKEFKDSKGWHLPGEAGTEPSAAPVTAPAFSQDILAKAAVAAGNPKLLHEDDDIEIWNVYGGKQIQVASKHDSSVSKELDKGDVTDDSLQNAIDYVKTAGAPKPPAAPTPAPTPAPVPRETPGEKAFNAYDLKSGSGKFYEDDDVTMAKILGGNVLIGNAKTGTFGNVKKDDVTPENLEKAINAIKAGHTWSVHDPIPDTVSAPPAAPSAAKVHGVLPDPADLKFTGKTVGTHHAKIYSGPGGSQYLFKPNPGNFKAAAEVDLATAKLHDEFGFITPDTGIVTLDGQTGSLQKMLPNTSSANPKTFDPKKLSPAEVIDVQKEHVFDWLVANHDAHSDNLLKEPGNPGLIGIDKGQAFKWFGQDKLSTTFNPNEHPQAANVLFDAYAKGVPGVDIKGIDYWEINAALNAIQDMPDDEFKAILRPMAQAMAKDGKLGVPGPAHLGLKKPGFPANDVEAFLDAATVRKNNIKQEMQAFYADLKAKHDLAVGLPAPSPAVAPVHLPAAGQKPVKLGASVLTGKKSTEYKHGQIIAVNPSQEIRLVWNDGAKKYQVQAQDPAGTWQTVTSYNKSAALTNLKDDDGWYTPEPGKDFSGSHPAPTISGGGTVAPVITPVSKPKTKPKTKLAPATVQRIAEADAEIDKLSAAQKTALFDYFKKGGGSSVYLSSAPDVLFAKAIKAQEEFNKQHNTHLTPLAVIRHADAATAAKLGVGNSKAYETKIADWLKTPKGAKTAASILADAKMTPADKVAAAAAKAAASKAALDTKLVELTAVKVSKPQIAAPGTTFSVISVDQANAIGHTMTDNDPWTAAGRAALKKYTGEYYQELNSALRGKTAPTVQNLKDAVNMQKSMRPLPQDMVLHRGLSAVPGILPGDINEYKALIGKEFVDNGFTSSSVGGKAAFGGKIRLSIEAPKGTPAAWVAPVSGHSEREMLLASGSKFRILEATMAPDGYTIDVKVRVVP